MKGEVMVDINDERFKKGLANLKKLTKKFNLDERLIDEYKKGTRIASVHTKEDSDYMKVAVYLFEKQFPDCFVYYTIYQDTPFGTVVNMLYYNNNKEEWYLNDISEDGWIYAATLNRDMDTNCVDDDGNTIFIFDFGDIKLARAEKGGLSRVG